MPKPAAKQDDPVRATDLHVEVVQGTPVMVPHPFDGTLSGELSPDVVVEHKAAALVTSTASNDPPHTPTSGAFATPPQNEGTVVTGSATVFANHKPMARDGDRVLTCNDPMDLPVGVITAQSTVIVGD